MENKLDKIKKFRERQLKKRYNVTLDEADAEELQIILGSGLSPSLQFVVHEFLEEWKDEAEAHGLWKEVPLDEAERKILDDYYKKDPERFGSLKGLPEMKRRRIERGRLVLIKKEKRNQKIREAKKRNKDKNQ